MINLKSFRIIFHSLLNTTRSFSPTLLQFIIGKLVELKVEMGLGTLGPFSNPGRARSLNIQSLTCGNSSIEESPLYSVERFGLVSITYSY